MGAKRQFESVPKGRTMFLPSDLEAQIKEKAVQMDVTFEGAVLTLIRLGLEAQQEREAKLDRLVEKFRSTEDDQERKHLADDLGSELFGK